MAHSFAPVEELILVLVIFRAEENDAPFAISVRFKVKNAFEDSFCFLTLRIIHLFVRAAQEDVDFNLLAVVAACLVHISGAKFLHIINVLRDFCRFVLDILVLCEDLLCNHLMLVGLRGYHLLILKYQ